MDLIFIVVSVIISFVLGVISTFKIWHYSFDVFDDMVNAAIAVRNAIEDDDITMDELLCILREVDEVFNSIESLRQEIE